MPQIVIDENGEIRHSDELKDIIKAPPSWLMIWGTTSVFVFLTVLLGMSAFIQYPDIVQTNLKISSSEVPKTISAKLTGKLTEILVKEAQNVETGQMLAFMESTANHRQVLQLSEQLHALQEEFSNTKRSNNLTFKLVNGYNLGELQSAYQTFVQFFLAYQSSTKNGIWEKKRAFLMLDLSNISQQEKQLNIQKGLYQNDLSLALEEYRMNQWLLKEKAETPAEFREAESRYLSKQLPLIQNKGALIDASNNYSAKQKELLEIDNQIREEKTKFIEALNSLVSQVNDWKGKFILSASQKGSITFAGNIQPNKIIQTGQEVIYINPGKEAFFGEVSIPQYDMGKVHQRQKVLIKLRGYPFEEFGILEGKIDHINDVPYKDSIFFARVIIDQHSLKDKRRIILKQGMIADVEIVTQDATLLERITRNIRRVIMSR